MKEVFIDVEGETYLERYFDKPYVSIEELLIKFDELDYENRELKDELEHLQENIKENYIAKWD